MYFLAIMHYTWLIMLLASPTNGLFLFNFLQSLFSSSPPVTTWSRPIPEKNVTGRVAYDPAYQKCCNGHVSNDTSLKCCGSKTYDPKSQICCDGTPNYRLNGSKCCGKKVFNALTELCCAGRSHLLDRDKLSLARCCILEYYLPETQVCCEHRGKGTVHEITDTLGLYCCGSELYDKNKQVCCSDKRKQEQYAIPLIGNNRSCCAGVTYDWSKNRCCGSTIVGKWQQCCGDGEYNHRTEACCVNEDIPYPEVRKISVSKREEGCCNGQRYDKVTHKCCDNKQAYDKKEQICCGGQVFTKTSNANLQCCHDKAFDVNEAKCVGTGLQIKVVMLHDYQIPVHIDKCVSSNAIDNKTELCCRTATGPVGAQKQSEEASSCCGKIAFSQGEGICCEVDGEYRFNLNTDKNVACCGLELYNLQTQLCCEKRVVPKLNVTSECCRESFYDKEFELCCGGIVVTKRNRNEVCCYGIQI